MHCFQMDGHGGRATCSSEGQLLADQVYFGRMLFSRNCFCFLPLGAFCFLQLHFLLDRLASSPAPLGARKTASSHPGSARPACGARLSWTGVLVRSQSRPPLQDPACGLEASLIERHGPLILPFLSKKSVRHETWEHVYYRGWRFSAQHHGDKERKERILSYGFLGSLAAFGSSSRQDLVNLDICLY